MLNVLLETVKTEIRNAQFRFPNRNMRTVTYLEPMLEVLDALIELLEPAITVLTAELFETVLDHQADKAEMADCFGLAADLNCARGAAHSLYHYLNAREGYDD